MKSKYFVCGLLIPALVLLVSCSDDEDDKRSYYHWTFDGIVEVEDESAGRSGQWNESDSGRNLTFSWKYGTNNEVVFAVRDLDNQFLAPIIDATKEDEMHCTYMSVDEHSENDYSKAVFTSMSSFATPQSDLANHKVYAVTPIITDGVDNNGSFVTATAEGFSATLILPDNFIQDSDKEPDFLHKYMYMCASETLNASGEGTLKFEHIPAVFRFIVSNNAGRVINLAQIEVKATNGDDETLTNINLAPRSMTLSVNGDGEWQQEAIAENGYYQTVTTTTNAEVDIDNTYIAYALIFPGVKFSDTDKITITASIDDLLCYNSITGAQLKQVTGSYSLMAGNLYTFHLRVKKDEVDVASVSADDYLWIEGRE